MTIERFSDTISGTAPVLVEFYRPDKSEDQGVLSHLESDFGSNAKIVCVNGTQSPELMKAYKVDTYPTFLLFKDGQVAWRDSGSKGYDELHHMVERFV